MKKRILTGLCIALTLALFFVLKIFVSDYFFDAFILCMAVFAGYEVSKIFTKIGLINNIIITSSFPAILFVSNFLCIFYKLSIWLNVVIDIALIILVSFCIFNFSLIYKGTKNEIKVRNLNISKSKFSFFKSLYSLAGFTYPSLFLMFMMHLNHFDALNLNVEGFNGLLSIIVLILAFLIPIFTDTFAMLTGILIGGKKLCPKISPKKTISGSVGGTLWCVLLMTSIYLVLNSFESFNAAFISDGLPIWAFILIVLFGSVISQAGDLFESFLKRKANIKDSGRILPGHGGMLDRIDSYIFVVPYLLICFCLIAI